MRWLMASVLVVGLAVLAQAQERKEEPSDDEKALLKLLNAAREKEKLPPLKPNPILMKVARAHSENMAKQDKMAHELDGKRPAQRVDEAGYDYRFVGENVAFSEGEGVTLADIQEGWMKSKVHRDNILRKDYEEVGVGLARNDKGKTYYTQVFGTQRKRR